MNIGFLTNFGSLEPEDTFQHNNKLYVKIWPIKINCCKPIVYNAVLRKDPAQGFTFSDDELVEKLP